MLDAFEIVTTSGIVIWRKTYAPVSSNVVNSLINDVFVEERGQKSGGQEGVANAQYRKDKYTLKWTSAKDVGLIFVAVYQSLLHLSWADNLLTAVRSLFVKQYGAQLKKPHTTKVNCKEFDHTFNALVQKLDTGSSRRHSEPESETAPELTPPSSSASATEGDGANDEPPPPPVPGSAVGKKKMQPRTEALIDDTTSTDATPMPTPETSRPSTPASRLLTGKAGPGRASRRSRKANSPFSPTPVSSGDEGFGRKGKAGKGSAKAKRRWDADGFAVDGEDDSVLDYSGANLDEGEKELDIAEVNAEDMGSRTGKGQFVLKDLDDELEAILAETKIPAKKDTVPAATEENSGLFGSASSRITGMFSNLVGGKTLTSSDLQKPLQTMHSHLVSKNVAPAAADRLCKSVETDLLNQKTASYTSIDKTIRASMSKALTHILTPTSSLDLLRNITSTIDPPNPRPYVISIVGVNGVGKSTSLSKIAYFLLQNKFRVLVVAADTFRSGAVEQLGVHVSRLSELSRRENVGHIELFEKGYGKDAATVARDAVTYATNISKTGTGEMLFDVVLIDTAGRRHNDTRLMSSLTKFGQLANPDKIFMVGEALVGTDSVAQARNFAKEFVDSKGIMRNGGVGMDGFIVSKCDTVGDMVGVMVSMVHATGIPVVFLGVGQHYGDLRGLNVGWAVDKLMK